MSIFKTVGKDMYSRAGVLKTPHGEIETPVFMPVGTQATVKSLTPDDLKTAGAQIILANTYHLYLRPGEKLIKKLGGLHEFMSWDKPILTDSGGFQVMSLGGSLVKITDDGVTFTSHLDGSKHKFTPEKSIQIQHDLGADIIMAFDEVAADKVGREYSEKALDRTHSWAERCVKEHKKLGGDQLLFGIVQGSVYEDLRKKGLEFISSLDFDGIALGGESIGFDNKATKEIIDWFADLMPEEKPHYAMGVGEVETIFICIEGGIDMFDCVSPTRRARNGSLYISPKNGGKVSNKFALDISNSQFKLDKKPIDPNCLCYTCQNFSRAYLRHLFFAKELLYHRLATIHNIYFMVNLVKEIRESILDKKFNSLKTSWLR
ncbi:tRNA guanosine(34) transglycosylase Tgt [Candidatus Daviesbacteria bacterium]|nr:tRNA guanosine(34) transglycosylase Tgt [Candidatus Daviesbacteria bacterium]